MTATGAAAPTPAPIPKYRFDETDRIGIGDKHFVCKQSTANGHLFAAVDNPKLCEFFTNDQVHAFMRLGALTRDAKYFDAASQLVLSRAEVAQLHDLTLNEQHEIVRRAEYVRRFLAYEQASKDAGGKKRLKGQKNPKVTRSDRSMRQIVGLIIVDMQRMDYESALARVNDGRRRSGIQCNITEPISFRTLRRWLKAYEDGERNVLALRPRYRFCGDRTPAYDFHAYAFIRKHAVAYAAREKPSVAKCHRDMEKDLAAFNAERRAKGLPEIELPSKALLRRHVKTLDRFMVDAQRLGIEEARKKHHPTGQGPDAVRLLQRVEMDAWEVHLKTLLVEAGVYAQMSPEQREVVEKVRMVLTVIIDCASRYILAMCLTPTESEDAGISALAMALSDKTAIARAAGALAPWNGTGTFEALFVDNGYLSASFRAIAIAAFPHASVTPAALPWLRPYIERLFRTFDLQLMPLFSGRTFANIIEAEGYDSAALASLTVEELATALVRFVVDVYHLSPHEGLGGKTPIDAWNDLAEEWAPLPPPDKNKFTALFGIARTRPLTKEGLKALGVTYQSEELQSWRRRHGQVEIEIKVHPDDVSFASAFFDGAWRRVTPTDDGLEGVSVAEFVAAAKHAAQRNAAKAAGHRITVLDALRDLAEIGRAARRRLGIGELSHTPEEIQHAEHLFDAGLNVSKAAERAALDVEYGAAPSVDVLDGGFRVGGGPAAPKAFPAPLTLPGPERSNGEASSNHSFENEDDDQ